MTGRPVCKIHPTSKRLIKEFESVSDLAKDLKVVPRSITQAISKGQLVRGWRIVYRDVYERMNTGELPTRRKNMGEL